MYREIMPYQLTMTTNGIVRNGIGFNQDENRIVRGYFTTDKVDFYGHQILKNASVAAMTNYLPWANVRNMHLPEPVARVVEYDSINEWNHMGAKVIDDTAWNRVVNRLYNGFSIGGIVLSADFVPVAEFEDDYFSLLTPSLRRVLDEFGLVFVISELEYVEISLVDIPANAGAIFTNIEKSFSTGSIGNNEPVSIAPDLYRKGLRGIKNGRLIGKSYAITNHGENIMNDENIVEVSAEAEDTTVEVSGELSGEIVYEGEQIVLTAAEAEKSADNSIVTTMADFDAKLSALVERVAALAQALDEIIASKDEVIEQEIVETNPEPEQPVVVEPVEKTVEPVDIEAIINSAVEKAVAAYVKATDEDGTAQNGKASVAVEPVNEEPAEQPKLSGQDMIRFIALKSAQIATVR